jgi:hypothetical protein
MQRITGLVVRVVRDPQREQEELYTFKVLRE